MIEALSSLLGPAEGAKAVDAARGAAAAAPAQTVTGPSFSDVLAEVSSGALGALKQGEAAAISGITGKSSVQEVVQAVLLAEQSLQTAIAIRDKIITAYLEVSRMQI